MKIKKNNILNESTILKEEDDPTVEVKDGGATTEVDIKVTDKTDEAEPVTKKEALKIKNVLTDVLDAALEDARASQGEDNSDANCNVLIKGLPGSSKTATVKNWCVQNGLNYFYLDAKNPDIQLLMSGGATTDKSDPSNPKIVPAYSNALAKLDRPNSILFLDELNRQVKDYLRGSLLTLIADKEVSGPGEKGVRRFDNLLFTIAATNPSVESDRGAVKLNEAERRRFYYTVIFNSEVATTTAYFNAYYDKKIKDWVEKHPDLTEADIKKINSFILRQYIGNKLIHDEDFHYTTFDDYSTITEETKIVCQSTITELIDHSFGDIEKMKRDVSWTGIDPKGQEMIINILNKIVLPDINKLRAKKATELGLDLKAEETVKEEPKKTEEDEWDFDESDFAGTEDDAETFSSASSEERKAAAKASDATVTSTLKDAVAKWLADSK